MGCAMSDDQAEHLDQQRFREGRNPEVAAFLLLASLFPREPAKETSI
jgi:hypothetical protein